jgi:hypothetical protein
MPDYFAAFRPYGIRVKVLIIVLEIDELRFSWVMKKRSRASKHRFGSSFVQGDFK